MSFATDCYGCAAGKHEQHDRDWGTTPGLIGGSHCDCPGDCAERQAAAFAASPFGRALADAARNHRHPASEESNA